MNVNQVGCPARPCTILEGDGCLGNLCPGCTSRLAALRTAATYALAVLTRLADSAAYWADYDVPVGIVAEIDAAKARLAGALNG